VRQPCSFSYPGAPVDFDPIALLDGAYQARGNVRAWLSANAPAIAACFDEVGIGCLSYFVRDMRFEPLHPEYQPGRDRSIDPAVALDVLARGAASVSRDLAQRVMVGMQQPGVHGLLETFGERVFAMERFGERIADAPAIVIPTGEHGTAVVVAFTHKPLCIVREHRLLWEAICLHFGAACRLSDRPAGAGAPGVEAVFDAGGNVLDCRGPAQRPAARALLRDAVRRRDRARTRRSRSRSPADLADWQPLYSGRWSLVDIEDRRRRLVLAHRNDPDIPASGLSRRQRQVLFYASLGWSPKQIAYALGLAPGTINNHLATALEKQGYASRAELVRVTAERAMRAIDAPQPPRANRLSNAERVVAAHVAAGWSNGRIAASRGVSVHTVANQLRSIYRKLRVSDRHELIRELARSQ
jgi:DNA-binding NarL/FixJ family response regulator